MGDTPVTYMSNAKLSFNGPPKNFVKAKPLREKQEQSKTSYSLGDDQIEYASAAMNHFGAKDASKIPPQPVYKNYNERVHIISGEIMDRNHKNAGYERYTENSQAFKT